MEKINTQNNNSNCSSDTESHEEDNKELFDFIFRPHK